LNRRRPSNEADSSATISREDEWYIAQCLEVDVASQGESEEDALRNLGEALQLHFVPPVATLTPSMRESNP
jgi:predicted RNase H-like HicB family nuclease